MGELRFVEDTHQYFVGDVELTSVTTFLGSYFEKFEPSGPSMGVSKQICNQARGKAFFSANSMIALMKLHMFDETLAKAYFKANRASQPFITPKKVRELWKWKGTQAANHGTEVHDCLEHYILGGTWHNVPESYEFGEKSRVKVAHGVDYIAKETSGKLFPELKVHVVDWFLAGTIDLMEEVGVEKCPDGKMIVDLHDWKSNEKIDFDGYKNKKGLGCLEHLDDCSFVKYSVQLTTYALMLEKTTGCKVRDIYIAHLTPDGYEKIECLDVREEVEEMIELHIAEVNSGFNN